MLREPVREIHFHAPGLRRYETSEYRPDETTRFVAISVTGTACALACDHCQMKVLQGMLPLPRREGGLFDLCAELAARGARGVLVSGGCDRHGRVPLRPHLADLKRVRRELGLVVRVHTGLLDEETAAGLAEVGVDGAMIDVIGADETIREVYHLDATVADYESPPPCWSATTSPRSPTSCWGCITAACSASTRPWRWWPATGSASWYWWYSPPCAVHLWPT